MVEPFGLDRVADHERELRVIKRMIMDLEERFRASPGGDDGQAQARLRQDVEALKQIVDQLSSREGVTLHRLETLKERIDEFTALGREVEELKKRAESLAGPAGSLPAEVVAAFTDGLREARQQLEVLRASQAAQAKRLDALKEENAKLRSEYRQLEAQAHAALEALQERGARLEERLGSAQASPPPPPPPRRVAARRSNLDSLRERAARVAEISDPSGAEDS
jgi:chromosome segregation ATPase